MIYLHLADCLGLPVPACMCSYRLACEHLASDIALEILELYRLPRREPAPPPEPSLRLPGGDQTSCRSVRGWLGGETREVVCHAGAKGFEIDVSGIGRFAVTSSAGHIRCVYLDAGLPHELIEEVLLGPPITLSLACRDVWCLHASAVNLGDDTVLFLGNSGQGKSTLARYCGGRAGFDRIADDILPCSLVDGEPCALPHFPQLKLPVADQYPADVEDRAHLNGMVFLDPTASGRTVRIESVPRIEAVKRLAAQTVIVGLFDRSLHERHLFFLSRLIKSVPTFVLHYPHDYGLLPDVCDAVARRLLIREGAVRC